MEEIIKRIEELKMQIEDIQRVYKIELEREKNEKNDQIQANRKNKIDKLQAELKIAEINKEEKMKEIKIKEIEKQIGGIQEIYANDLERGKSIENDQIQANRQHKIIKLQDEIEKIKTNESDKKEKNVIDNSIKNNFINLMNGKNVETDKVRGKVADSLFENESFSKEEIEEANKIAKIKKEGIFKKSIKKYQKLYKENQRIYKK